MSNLCQISYAIAMGFLFVMLFYRGKSLWTCIIVHSVFNSLSAFSNKEMMATYLIPVSILLIVVSLGYSLFIIKKELMLQRYITTIKEMLRQTDLANQFMKYMASLPIAFRNMN